MTRPLYGIELSRRLSEIRSIPKITPQPIPAMCIIHNNDGVSGSVPIFSVYSEMLAPNFWRGIVQGLPPVDTDREQVLVSRIHKVVGRVDQTTMDVIHVLSHPDIIKYTRDYIEWKMDNVF